MRIPDLTWPADLFDDTGKPTPDTIAMPASWTTVDARIEDRVLSVDQLSPHGHAGTAASSPG